MWREIGVDVEIRSYEFATFYADIKRGSFQLFSLTWTGIADPDIYMLILHSKRAPPAGSNRGRYSNPRFDALVEQGARLADRAARRPLYVEAQQIVAHDLPYLSLFTKVNVAVLPAGLVGYRHYPSGELHSLRTMHWAEREMWTARKATARHRPGENRPAVSPSSPALLRAYRGRDLPPTVRRLGAGSFFQDVASEMVYPLLPGFLAALGGGAAVLGAMESAAEGVLALVKGWAGRASDRLGRRKPFVVAGYGASALARPLLALAATASQVIALRLWDRLAKGLRTAPRDALIAEAVAPGERAYAFSYHRGLDHLGAACGPLLAAVLLLVSPDAMRTVFLVATLPALAGFLTVAFGLPRETMQRPRRRSAAGAAPSLARGPEPLPGRCAGLSRPSSVSRWAMRATPSSCCGPPRSASERSASPSSGRHSMSRSGSPRPPAASSPTVSAADPPSCSAGPCTPSPTPASR